MSEKIHFEQPEDTILFSQHVCEEIKAGRWAFDFSSFGEYITSPTRSKIIIEGSTWNETFSLQAYLRGLPWKRKPKAYLMRGSYNIRLERSEMVWLYDAYVFALNEIKRREFEYTNQEAIKIERLRWWP